MLTGRCWLKTMEMGDERPLLELWVVRGPTSLGITLLFKAVFKGTVTTAYWTVKFLCHASIGYCRADFMR